VTGAVVGNEMDKNEAKERALIEAKLGRQMAGAVRVEDVIAMTQYGVAEDLIINHIRAHGIAAPLQPPDLIAMQQQHVSTKVIAVMQATPVAVPPPDAYPYGYPPPEPVVVGGLYYGPRPRPYRYRCY
jgi:hypothetical protein